MALLKVRDLHTHFNIREGVVRAVDGVTFEANSGEVVGLVGESGCGKSTAALSLMRLLPAHGMVVGGEIMFDGQDVLKMDDDEVREIRGKSMAMIFQDPMTSLNPVLTIGLQVSEALELHLNMTRSQARNRTIELLNVVGISGAKKRLDDYPHQFSGGMRQRLMIATAISCNPKLILADEITTALDVTTQAQILDLLRNLGQELGTSLILITHDLGIIAGSTQRVYVMYAGRVVETAETTELFANPKMPYTWGLLRSIPRLGKKRAERLIPIEGLPPDPTSPPLGCRFQPRCPYRRDICHESEPNLISVANARPGHEARCWGMQNVPGGGWLLDVDWRREGTGLRSLGKVPAEVAESGSHGKHAAPSHLPLDAAMTEGVSMAVSLTATTGHRPAVAVRAEKLLDVRGLTVHFPITQGIVFQRKVGAVRAVDGIDFFIERGETLGLVGESGCGKSTTGRAILRLCKLTAGSVKFDGSELTTLGEKQIRRLRRRMQIVFQDPYASLNPRMTVGDLISEPLEVHDLARGPERVERVQELLRIVGLSKNFTNRYPHEFSGGQRQRIAIARALAAEPEFLVADEPLSALDVSIQAQIIDLLQELQAEFHLTYLFISHDLSVVHHISSRVVVMYLGKIVEVADCSELYERPLHPYTLALLSAVPNPYPQIEAERKRIILTGDVASSANLPSGCRFHTRCWLYKKLGNPEICSTAEPDLIEYSPRHSAACHFTAA